MPIFHQRSSSNPSHSHSQSRSYRRHTGSSNSSSSSSSSSKQLLARPQASTWPLLLNLLRQQWQNLPPPPAVHVSWNLPSRAATAQHTAQQPDSPSTITSPGTSWRERDARRSGDSSSSGEYPGRYIRSLPMLLSVTTVAEDGPEVVSNYMDSMRRHFEASPESALGSSAGEGSVRDGPQSGAASGLASAAALSAEAGLSRNPSQQSLSSSASTAASRLCALQSSMLDIATLVALHVAR